MASLSTRTITLATATALSQGALALGLIVVARDAGQTALGQVVITLAVATLIAGVVDFGTNNFWVRELAVQRVTLKQLSPRVNGKFAAATALGSLASVVGSVAYSSHAAWIAPIAVLTLVTQSLQVPLRAEGRTLPQATSTVVNRLIFGATFGLQLWLGVGAGSAILLAVAAGFLADGAFLASAGSYKLLAFTRPALPWQGALKFGLASLATSAQNADLPILGMSVGASTTGTFGAVNRWVQPMTMTATAVCISAASDVNRASTTTEAIRVFRRVRTPLIVAVGVNLTVAALAPWIVPILLGQGYSDSSPVLSLMAIGASFVVLNQPLVIILQARKRDGFVSACLLSSVVGYLAAVSALGSQLGAVGAGLAYLLLQLVVTLFLAAGLTNLLMKDRSEARHEGKDAPNPRHRRTRTTKVARVKTEPRS